MYITATISIFAKNNIRYQPSGVFFSAVSVLSHKLILTEDTMFWTPELASYLEDAPWPATKEELIDYASRSGAAQQVIDNLLELEDNDELYEGMEDLWPEYESAVDDLYFNEDEESDDYY